MTTSREWVSGSAERVCATSYGLTTDVSISIRLQQIEPIVQRRRQRTHPAIYSHTPLVLPAGRWWLTRAVLATPFLGLGVFVGHRVGQKTGLLSRVDNFAIVNGRKACDMSKVSEFCLEKDLYLHVSAFKYFCLVCINLSPHVKVCWIWHGFYQLFNWNTQWK